MQRQSHHAVAGCYWQIEAKLFLMWQVPVVAQGSPGGRRHRGQFALISLHFSLSLLHQGHAAQSTRPPFRYIVVGPHDAWEGVTDAGVRVGSQVAYLPDAGAEGRRRPWLSNGSQAAASIAGAARLFSGRQCPGRSAPTGSARRCSPRGGRCTTARRSHPRR